MPSFLELYKSKWKTIPFGFYHLLNARNNSKDVTFTLLVFILIIKVKEHMIIFKEYHTTFTERNSNCIRTPELADNHAIHAIWKNFDPKIHCRRKTFRLTL
jgi:hypothetical protein